MLRNSLLLLAITLAFPASRAAAQTKPYSAPFAQAAAISPRITQAIDETQLVRLKGNVHPLARPEFDKGVVSDAMPAKRMLLLLKRSVDQESALAELMIDHQNAASPNYHKWLTPEQFGAKFGPADVDIQTVVSWLESYGFQVAKVSKGKIAIEFSGTAGQVREAFHTQIHKFLVNGEVHVANVSVPQIPAALAPVVQGLAPLHNFRPKPAHHVAGEFTRSIGSSEVTPVKPQFTTSGGNYAIGPTDFATIYNVLPLWNAATPIDGTGQSIAVIGVSNINLQDVTDFRTLFGLPTGGASNTPKVVIDGDDPGIPTPHDAETEALLDTEWSGAVAKGAQIHLVIAADTDLASGFILAIFNVIDNNSDPILSLSFSDCEPNEGANNGPPTSTSGFWEPLWTQASAQGITVTVATGDSGSAGCESQTATVLNPNSFGLQVNAFASTPFTVAVGGTDFNDAGNQPLYFKPSSMNDPNTLVSALSYIPESTWNETCTNSFFGMVSAEANCNNAANQKAVITVGGGGGKSHCFTLTGTTCSGSYPKPAYQSFLGLTGMPADGARDLPDVSLFASSGVPSKSFYAICEADAVTAPSCQKGQAFHFLGVGGTSASTPSFAGIMALVNQKAGQRQGNANFALYKLALMQDMAGTACNSLPSPSPLPAAACTFNDVTVGTIAMPCIKGTLDCITSVGTDAVGVLSSYSATAGYDLATGLGSVNATNLVNNWSTAVNTFTPTTTTLSISPLTGITAGQVVTVNITVTPGAPVPTGNVALVSTAATGEGVDGFTLDSTGKVVNGTTNQLTGGMYQVTARYAGDGTYRPSVSLPVTVTVGKAASTTVGSVLVSTGGGNYAPFVSGPSPVTLFLKASINPTGTLLPTGTVDFVDTVNGTQTTVASNVGVNATFEAFTFPGISTFIAGNHSIVANYSGDPSFNASNSAAVAFTITSAGSFTVSGAAVTVAAGSSGMSNITVTPSGGFTGIVNVTCGGIPGVSCTPNPLAINIASASPVASNLTITVTAPSSSTTAAVAPLNRTVYAAVLMPPAGGKGWWTLSVLTGLAAMLLVVLPGKKRYRAALAFGLVCVLSFTLGCGGSYSGGGGGGGGITATTTHLTVSTTKLAVSSSITVSATVTGGTPTGNVQFFVDGVALGSAAPVSNGTTGTITLTAAQAPAFLQLVGTHTVSAHYLGSTYTAASQSGTLNVTVTGTTSLPITGTSGGIVANGNISLTIN